MRKLILIFIMVILSASCLAFSKKDHIYEGQGKIYMTKDNVGYVVELVMVSDSKSEAVFNVNGETSKALREKETYYFKDGSFVIPSDIIVDDGPDYVMYYFGSGSDPMKIEVDKNSPITGNEIKVETDLELETYEVLQVDENEKVPLDDVIEESIKTKKNNFFEVFGDLFISLFSLLRG